MKKPLFVALTLLLVLVVLELGSCAVVSISAGAVRSYADLARLRESRLDTDPVEIAREPKDWREHRIARPPALHPFIGYVANPVDHPRFGEPGFSRQSAEYGFPLNRVDLFREVDDDEVVIGVFGGSFAASLGAGGRRLARDLRGDLERFGGKKLTVTSFAIAGHKQPQQLMALNYLLALGVHLDVVINLDGFNEIALPSTTNVPKGYNAFYPRGWLLMVDDLDQELRLTAGELTYLRRRRAERAAFFSRPPLSYSMTAGLAWTILDAPLTRRIAEAERALLEEERSPSGNYQARGPRREYESDAAMFADLVAFWKRASLTMDGVCRRHGVEYYHFLQPNQYFPGSKPLSPEERRIAWNESHPYKPAVEQAYPRLVAAGEELRREGVAFHDLSMVFADSSETVYRDPCCHVNHRGNRVIAREIARALDESVHGSGGRP